MTINNLDRNHLFSIQIELWSTRVDIAYGDSVKFFKKSLNPDNNPGENKPERLKILEKKILKQIKPKNSLNVAGTYQYHRGSDIHLIVINPVQDALALVRIASHEANHAAFQILENIGIELAGQSEEAYTYLQDYILFNILKTIDSTDEELGIISVGLQND